MTLILASGSPRRQELLTKITSEFTVQPADIDESVPEGITPKGYVELMALEKAKVVFEKEPNAVVIGCDTTVVCDQQIMGKPKDATEAKEMLMKLSGRDHIVYTTVCIMSQERQIQETVSAEVAFFDLTTADIDTYLATDEYADKAGAYGIQGQGALLVKSIKGDYYAIVGFPVAYVSRMLREFTY